MCSPLFLAGKPAPAVAFDGISRKLSLLFIYSRIPGFSIHGSEMYLQPHTLDGSNWTK
jgi:hypothetical protein